MSGVNKVILVGRVGKDPEVRNFESGSTLTTFSMVTSETYKDKATGEKKEITDWHNIVLWRGLAEIAQKYVHKGDMLYIEGKMRTRSWEKDGVTRYTTEVVGDNMTMLTPKGSGSSSGNSDYAPQEKPMTEAPSGSTPPMHSATDDLPF